VAIAVELASSIGSRLDVVTFFEVCLADGLDRVRPLSLAVIHVTLEDRRELDGLARFIIATDDSARRGVRHR